MLNCAVSPKHDQPDANIEANSFENIVLRNQMYLSLVLCFLLRSLEYRVFRYRIYRADFISAVYFRRDLTCALGLNQRLDKRWLTELGLKTGR